MFIGEVYDIQALAFTVSQLNPDINGRPFCRLILYSRIILVHDFNIKQPNILGTSRFHAKHIFSIRHIGIINRRAFRNLLYR